MTTINPDSMSIGELATRCGVSALRLRAWEKRYGYPSATKLDSGHRRYNHLDLQKLLLVQQLLENGFKISKIIPHNIEELTELITANCGKRITPQQINNTNSKSSYNIKQALQFVDDYNEDELFMICNHYWNTSTPLEFVEEFTIPFLDQLGSHWTNKIIDISKEHFASNFLKSFIQSKWRKLNRKLQGNSIILAMLPNDFHSFGLQICALLSVIGKQKIIYLGERTPIEAIKNTTNHIKSSTVVLSVSNTMNDQLTIKYLKQLRDNISENVVILQGGAGAQKVDGVEILKSFKEYVKWIQTKNNQ
jgi:DNA-binding transcriptional MerR regulator